jgi:hypothetical protein
VSLPVISVIIPTVDGREDHFERCWQAYRDCAGGAYELNLIIERNHPTCGAAWQAGLDRASTRARYFHFTCDDIEPHPGWAQPAVEAADLGFLPAPQVYAPDGYPQSCPQVGVVGRDWAEVSMTALPFVSRAQLEKIVPLLTCHYYTDDWFSYRGSRQGWRSRLRTGYSFTHHWAQHLRGAGMTEGGRMQYDELLFQQARKMVEAGQWTEPWPPPEIARPNG